MSEKSWQDLRDMALFDEELKAALDAEQTGFFDVQRATLTNGEIERRLVVIRALGPEWLMDDLVEKVVAMAQETFRGLDPNGYDKAMAGSRSQGDA